MTTFTPKSRKIIYYSNIKMCAFHPVRAWIFLSGVITSCISMQGGNVPALKGKNSRKRSLSENWLEHKPTTTVNSGALLQPVYKKKKTVTNPQPRDLRDQQMNKYCLQHQEEDSQGAVKTSLYKVSYSLLNDSNSKEAWFSAKSRLHLHVFYVWCLEGLHIWKLWNGPPI